jgi:lysozyme
MLTLTFQDAVLEQIVRHEGTGPTRNGRMFPYVDSEGKLTIGFGRNLADNGISRAEAYGFLRSDVEGAFAAVIRVFGENAFGRLTDARKIVLINMMYNLGSSRFSKFVNMIDAVRREQWELAADEMLDSKWAGQVKSRAEALAMMMRTGEVDAPKRI